MLGLLVSANAVSGRASENPTARAAAPAPTKVLRGENGLAGRTTGRLMGLINLREKKRPAVRVGRDGRPVYTNASRICRIVAPWAIVRIARISVLMNAACFMVVSEFGCEDRGSEAQRDQKFGDHRSGEEERVGVESNSEIAQKEHGQE